MNKNKVFVSGCYDMLHSGHFAFFEEASKYGDLYVGIGSDKTIFNLKKRHTIVTEDERLYMIKSLKFVKDAFINTGSGKIDFENEIKTLKPDILFVNEDGDLIEKKNLCKKYNIKYIVSKRLPKKGLPERSTTNLRKESSIPYRIDLAGGWLDQPNVSKYFAGSVITVSVEPNIVFNDRSGMSTSTRYKAIEMWKNEIPSGNKEQLAKQLFAYENPPGSQYISGSQDSIGIVMPGLNKLFYNGGYWVENIESVLDDNVLNWLEEHIYLIELTPRIGEFNVLSNTNINQENAKKLSKASENVWESINNLDLKNFGKHFTESFESQIRMYPNMVNNEIMNIIDLYKNKVLGWKITGAGGGGYIILISDKKIKNSIKINIRRK